MNAVLPDDVWIKSSFEMREDFHARYSALSRTYVYLVGTDDEAESPFRRHRELVWRKPIDVASLRRAADEISGEHSFRAFAVKGTAPETDDHRCDVREAVWLERQGGLAFQIRANRFLHHMVRNLVGTFILVGKRSLQVQDISRILEARNRSAAGATAPARGLYLVEVEY
jgi:tRNA pseudouridine38-40 synthase